MGETLHRPHAGNLQSATNLTFSPICHHRLCSRVTAKYNYRNAAGRRRCLARVTPLAERALVSRSMFDFVLKTSARTPRSTRRRAPQPRLLPLQLVWISGVSPVLHEGGQGLHAGSDGTDGEPGPGSRVRVGQHGLDHFQNICVSEQTELTQRFRRTQLGAPPSHPGGSTSRRPPPPAPLRLSGKSDRNRCR